jgi:uncharacterized membrane protein YdjX (TVP38/TMEM64 family)
MVEEQDKQPTRCLYWRLVVIFPIFFLLLGTILLLIVFWVPLQQLRLECFDFTIYKEKVGMWIKSLGPLAPLVFIVAQALQVVIAPIPGEVTGFLGGFLFGALPGFFYSTIGITLGSILAFSLARWVETHVLERVVCRESLEKFNFLVERGGALVAFLLFLMPGTPKDYLSFILGLSKIPLRLFVVLVGFGRMPATLMLSLQGAQVYHGRYLTFVWLLGGTILLAGMGYIYRQKLSHWLRQQGNQTEV